MIYLDNNATTQIAEEVLEAMLPYLRDNYGNASSIQHKLGRQASHAVESARNQIATYLHVSPKELYFTSGATESINTVLKGVADRYTSKGRHIITCQTEHKAVLSTCAYLEKKGMQITYLPVDSQGNINLQELKDSITPSTILVSIMAANNETGLIHPLEDIADICQEKDVLFFCDATQYMGKKKIDLQKIAIDILCFSGHKLHAAKGVGSLYVRRKSKPIQIESLLHGGNQENGKRGGTYNIAGIVSLGKALEIADNSNFISSLRDYFEELVYRQIEDIFIYSQYANRLPNTSTIVFKQVKAAELMTKLPDIAVSSGSACVSGSRDPSHVLTAMGATNEDAFCSIRFSFSRYNTKKEVEQVCTALQSAVSQIRDTSPIWQMYKKGLL